MTEDVTTRRLVYLRREVARALLGFPQAEAISRKVVPAALRALDMFDQREYAENEWIKLFEEDRLESHQQAVMFAILSEGVKQIRKWCDVHHEEPKMCECAEISRVLLGLIPAVEELKDGE
jgi:3-methyladenine DNA glycosylase AlkD